MFQVLQRQLRRLKNLPVELLAWRVSKIFVPGLAFLILACSDDIEKLKLSKTEEVRIQQLQNPFGENYVRFNVAGQEQPVLLGLKDCNLYRAKLRQGVVTEWVPENALAIFYPMWSACSKESLKRDGEHISLSFCKTPIGAGGGCAGGGGDFRSINGKDWQLLGANGKWKDFAKPTDGEK